MTYMEKEIKEQPSILENLFIKTFKKANILKEQIKKKDIKYIYLAGRGTSDNAGVYLKYIMESYVGIPVALAAPSVITLYNGKLNLKECLVIGISQSGEALDVLEVINLAKKQGAITLTITNYENSPLAKISDFHFNCFSGEEKSVAATKTFTAEMFIGAIITATLSDNKDLLELVKNIPNKAKQYIEEYDINDSAIQLMKDKQECFVLARGMNYPIALEGALKIQETCYVRARAYSLSDFYHGPLAMLQENTYVILIAPKGESSKDIIKIIEKLNDNKCIIIAFTNDEDISELCTKSINIYNDMSDFESPILNAIAIQRFALQLSLSKGLNPDQPRNLRKVTLTK